MGPPNTNNEIEGRIVEILPGFGLAHVVDINGLIYGINSATPGIDFASLREGQRVLCVTGAFNKVMSARLLG